MSSLPEYPTFPLIPRETAITRFDRWIRGLKNLFTAMSLAHEERDRERKRALMLHYGGEEMQDIFETFTFNAADRADLFEATVVKFKTHFEPQKNIDYYVFSFREERQRPDEDLATFSTRLTLMAKKCDFHDADVEVKRQIMAGCKSDRLRRRAMENSWTLADILKNGRAMEMADSQMSEHKVSVDYHSKQRTQSRSQPRQHDKKKTQDNKTQQKDNTQQRDDNRSQKNEHFMINDCTRCGRNHPIRQCPAFGQECGFCKKKGHYARKCKAKNKRHVDYNSSQMHVSDTPSHVDDVAHAHVWSLNTHVAAKHWSKTVDVVDPNSHMHVLVDFKLDTGAEISILNYDTYLKCKSFVNLVPSNVIISGFGNQPVTPVGQIDLPCKMNDEFCHITCHVVKDQVPNLLSLNELIRLNLVRRIDNLDGNAHARKDAMSLLQEFEDVFTGVGKLPIEVSLKIHPNSIPVAHAPRPIPVALKSKVEAKLNELETDGIIEKIPPGTPTPWCSAMHIVPKKDGQVRITIDPQDLNQVLMREYYPSRTVEEIAQQLSGTKLMTVLDAHQGYFQLPLDRESRQYTAFNTPFGRYWYKRLPMGITSAPELFQRTFNDVFGHIKGLNIIMDDFLIAAADVETHNKILREVLQTARDNGVKFTKKKLQLCTTSVAYSGHIFSTDGLHIDPDRVKAINQMPMPQSVENIRTFLGMVTYVGKAIPQLSAKTEPLRDLIKEANQMKTKFKWHWEEEHIKAVGQIKKDLANACTLRYYDSNQQVTVQCDASQAGLGCVLMQEGQPVHYGSRALSNAEKSYAQVEKEMLAIVFAVTKFHTYLYGRKNTIVETDHQPLIRIMQKPLYRIPLRLQKMRMRLQGYDLCIQYKRGTDIPVADALSRAYLPAEEEGSIFEVNTEEMMCTKQLSDRRLQQIQEETKQDSELQGVIQIIKTPEGWPKTRSLLPPEAKPYHDYHEDLSCIDGIVFKGQRVVVPKALRGSALQALHQAHQGIVKTKQLARDLLFWPGIGKQIEDIVSRCSTCQENRRCQQKEPLKPTPIPPGPWIHVATDLFDCLGKKWIILIDYYSEFFEIEELRDTTAPSIIRQLKKWFSCHGIPTQVTSDNGPPYNSTQWKQFADCYKFQHNTSSPRHPQGNGMVEKGVAIAKNMLKKCAVAKEDPYLALLAIRNTPRDAIIGSPAQRLFGRRTRTSIPTHEEKLEPKLQDSEEVRQKLYMDRHVRAPEYFNRGARKLPQLHPGDNIRFRNQDKWTPARLNHEDRTRSYQITLPSGYVTRRNRRDLLRTVEDDFVETPIDEDDPIQVEPENAQLQENEQIGLDRPVVTTRSGRTSRAPRYLDDYVR